MADIPKILVVDDEPAVRRLLVRMLRSAGYEVDEAEDGLVGWNLALAQRYDLVVTDSHMPRMSGPDLIARLRNIYPTLRIIQVSGSSPDVPKGYQLPPDIPTLFKPFQLEQLIDEVRRILDTAPNQGVPGK